MLLRLLGAPPSISLTDLTFGLSVAVLVWLALGVCEMPAFAMCGDCACARDKSESRPRFLPLICLSKLTVWALEVEGVGSSMGKTYGE